MHGLLILNIDEGKIFIKVKENFRFFCENILLNLFRTCSRLLSKTFNGKNLFELETSINKKIINSTKSISFSEDTRKSFNEMGI